MEKQIQNGNMEEILSDNDESVLETQSSELRENNDANYDELEKQIALLEQQIKDTQDKLLRSMAECENIRTRSNKQIEEAREYSISSFSKDLVSVMDNLSRALEHSSSAGPESLKNLSEGVLMTKSQMESVFKNHGLESIEPQPGEKFDYNLHYAISQVMTDEFKEGTIVQTVQVGYKIKERLIRPAGVTVAKTQT